ncbi:MAG: hypothetical protein JO247_17680 [Chloroflexi bacterium]|nr:hypothetical protein [Chloroflexota bacterium]
MWLIASFTLDFTGFASLLSDMTFQVAVAAGLLLALVSREAVRAITGAAKLPGAGAWTGILVPLGALFAVVVLYRFATLARF